MKFELIKKSKDGVRNGRITTGHGVINTPFFMPVATVGSVKGVSPQELKDMGAQIVLSNTYHLYLRPGEKLIKELGGLHEFMRWDGPILTDSGGYQVFSLGENKVKSQKSKVKIKEDSSLVAQNDSSKNNSRSINKSLVKISEDGVEFTSHLDGSKHFFTPEKVIDIQLDLGVNILMPLDVCPSGKASRAEIEEAVRLTILWAKRAKAHFDRKIQDTRNNNQELCHSGLDPESIQLDSRLRGNDKINGGDGKGMVGNSEGAGPEGKKLNSYDLQPGLFGIVQGGLDPDLRKYCAQELMKLDFDGYSIGGLAVDHETRDMWKTVKLMGEILPADKPRYLMGVGTPDDIITAINLGVDMFDCVLPTRLARHGSVYVHKPQVKRQKLGPSIPEGSKVKSLEGEFELINLLNSKYRTDGGVIEEGCGCPACSGGFAKAYISHLIRCGEILGLRLASLHNLYQYLQITCNYRNKLTEK